MSSFMLERESFQAIANTLAKQLPARCYYSEDPALALKIRPKATEAVPELVSTIVSEWYDANRLVVNLRYGDDHPAGGLFKPKKGPTYKPVEFIKVLHCLAYQCSGDVPAKDEERHELLIEEIKRCAMLVAEAFVSASDAYDQAPWGREPVA